MGLKPSKLFTRLFQWFCEDDFFEELQGDLEEKFFENAERFGTRKAQRMYAKEVLLMIRPSVLKQPAFVTSFLNISLFSIHLKLTLRNLVRNKVFSAVNILGLAATLSLCLIFVNLIYTGYNMDRQHPEVDRLYRVTTEKGNDRGRSTVYASSSYLMGERLKNDFPQIEKATTLYNNLRVSTKLDGSEIDVSGIYIDSVFFDLFEFEVIAGDPKAMFNDINSIVLTEEAAYKLFGDEKPINEILGGESTVKAIIKSPKTVSHLDFEVLGNIESYLATVAQNPQFTTGLKDWDRNYLFYNYFRLKENQSPQNLEDQFRLLATEVDELIGIGNQKTSFKVQPVSDINFGDELVGDMANVFPRSIRTVILFLMVVVMLLASFNYTNLSIARALQRTKEIGIRKIAGSTRRQIISQFLIETCAFSFLALLIGFGVYTYFLPVFPQLLPEFSGLVTLEPNYGIILSFVLFSLVLGLLSGILPSLYFAKTSPLTAINKRVKHNPLSLINLRRLLVGVQLSLSMLCILLIFVGRDYYKQVAESELGFKSEDLVTLRLPFSNEDQISPILDKIPEVKDYTLTSFVPGTGAASIGGVTTKSAIDSTYIYLGYSDEHFTNVYQPKLLKGTGFDSNNFSKDVSQVIVDITLLDKLRISLDSAVGTQLTYTLQDRKDEKFQIVGVMDHYIRNALEMNLYPMVIQFNPDLFKHRVTLSFQEGGIFSGIEKLESAWKEEYPDTKLEVRFVDDMINASYGDFKGLVKIITFLGIVIISISLLGQLGLSLYKAETRVKEIGIRKTLGARAGSIILKLLKGTAMTIIIAAAITIPMIYLFFGQVASEFFSTPTEINAIPFGLALLTLTGITGLIIVSQTWRIASQNPAESLRYE